MRRLGRGRGGIGRKRIQSLHRPGNLAFIQRHLIHGDVVEKGVEERAAVKTGTDLHIGGPQLRNRSHQRFVLPQAAVDV